MTRPGNLFRHHASKKSAYVKISLLTGKKLKYYMPGPPPGILVIEAPGEHEGERGARVVCRRTGLDDYRQMTVKELVKAGIIKHVDEAKQGDGDK